MTQQHTPGPWFYYVTPSGVRYKVHGPTVDHFICDVKGANDLANARLIAAAPELLEALQLFVQVINRSPAALYHYGEAIQKGEAAIEKATGGNK